MRSQVAVHTLAKADPVFSQLCELLYGEAIDPQAVWEDVFKASPDQADASVPGQSNTGKLKRRAALAATIVGGALGVKELRSVVPKAKGLWRTKEGWLAPAEALKDTSRLNKVPGAVNAIGRIPRPGPATRALGVTGMFAGDIAASDELKKKPQQVNKAVPMHRLVRGSLIQQRRLVRHRAAPQVGTTQPTTGAKANVGATGTAAASAGGSGGIGGGGGVGKNLDLQWAGEFTKFDDSKRLAFGWASVCKVNGLPVVDRQGDYIDPGDLEDAVYTYVQHSRIGGNMHKRAADGSPHKVGELVESFMVTDEKVAKMGLPANTPRGWWVGFKIVDDDAWDEVRKQEKRGFSIHGKGLRKSIDYDDLLYAGS